jgi:hypothetical protein
MANVHDAGGEVHVVPAEAEHLGEAHARERPREKQRRRIRKRPAESAKNRKR